MDRTPNVKKRNVEREFQVVILQMDFDNTKVHCKPAFILFMLKRGTEFVQ